MTTWNNFINMLMHKISSAKTYFAYKERFNVCNTWVIPSLLGFGWVHFIAMLSDMWNEWNPEISVTKFLAFLLFLIALSDQNPRLLLITATRLSFFAFWQITYFCRFNITNGDVVSIYNICNHNTVTSIIRTILFSPLEGWIIEVRIIEVTL